MANKTFFVGVPNGQTTTYKLYHSAGEFDSSTSGMTLLGTLSSTFQSFTVDDSRYLYLAQGDNTSVLNVWSVGDSFAGMGLSISDKVEANGNYVYDNGQISSLSPAGKYLRFRPDPGNPSGGGAATNKATRFEFKLTTDNANNEKAIAYGVYISGSSSVVREQPTAVASASADTNFPATVEVSGVTYAFNELKIYNEKKNPASSFAVASDTNQVVSLPKVLTASMDHGTGTLDQTIPGTNGQVSLIFGSGSVSTATGGFTRQHHYQPPQSTSGQNSAVHLNTIDGGIAFVLSGSSANGAGGGYNEPNSFARWASTIVKVPMGSPTDWRDVFQAFFTSIDAQRAAGKFSAVSKSDPADINGTGTITVTYNSGVETTTAVTSSTQNVKPLLFKAGGMAPFRRADGTDPVSGSIITEAVVSFDFSLIGTTLAGGGETPLATSTFDSVSTSGSFLQAGGVSGSAHATLNVPAGALASSTLLGIDLSQEGNPIINGITRDIPIGKPVKYSDVISLTPHGQTFSSAVTVKFKLTGSHGGSCPSDLKIYKSRGADDFWYELPSDFWSCSSGVITINTTEFSRYQAVGGKLMTTTTIKDGQLAKITSAGKLEAQAIDITGSAVQSSIVPADRFIIQSVGGTAKSVSASVMQDFFSAVDVTASNSNESFQLVFHDGTPGAKLARDTNLVYNASTNILTVPKLGAFEAAGAIDFSDEAMTNVNIDGGAIDDTVIGANTKAAGSFTTLSGSGIATIKKVVSTEVDIDGGAIDATVIGASTPAAGTFAALVATGDVDLGNAASDTITVTGQFDSDLVPSTDSARSLGSATKQWANVHADAGNIDTVVASVLTASHASITNLDVYNINSVTQTETTLEVVDKKILAGSGSASAAVDGGGLQIGSDATGADTVASILYDHANTAIDFNIGGTTQVRLQDGVLRPETDDDVDLGASGAEFKNLFLDGTANIDSLVADTADINGGTADNLVIGGTTAAAGTFTTLSGSGIATIKKVVSTEVDIGGGAIDGTVIGANSAAAGTFAALVATSADINGAGDVSDTLTLSKSSGFGLVVTSDADINGGLDVEGASDIADTLTLSKASGFGLVVTSDVDVNGGLDVEGASDIADTLTLSKSSGTGLVVGAAADLNGTADIADTLTLSKGSGTALTVSNGGAAVFNGDVDLGNATSDTITATGRFDSDLVPSTDGARDLGASSLEWKDLYLDGVAYIDTIGSTSDKVGVGHFSALSASHARIDNLDVYNINSVTQTETTLEVVDKKILAGSGSASAAVDGGGLQIGGGQDGLDNVASILYDHANTALDFNIGGTTQVRLQDGVLRPETDDDVDLGADGAEFKNLFLDGTANIDSLVADTADINGGTADNIVIGGTTPAAVSATSLSASSTLQVGGAATFGNESVTFKSLADLTNSDVAHGDKFVIQDASAAGVAKEITFNHVAAKLAGDGLLNTNGVLSIQSVTDIATAASRGSVLSVDRVTASLSQVPLDAASIQVYRNGVLQLSTGSAADYYDYEYEASANRVLLRSALGDTDVLQLRYIKKNA